MNRIDRMFAGKRESGQAAMIFYVTAGYPSLPATETVIDALAEGGADLIELGVPFSDPIADGPTIQKSSQAALERGTTLRAILELAARVRQRHPDLPMMLFSAYNPICHAGDAAFVPAIVQSGIDGVLIPDLPPEESDELRTACRQADLATVYLIAPTTTPQRAAMIAEASTGFVYYVSLRGVTGARAQLPADLAEKVAALKALTPKPVAVGFGISTPEQAHAVASITDGVVIGSALIKLIGPDPQDGDLARRVRDYARSLTDAVRAAQSR